MADARTTAMNNFANVIMDPARQAAFVANADLALKNAGVDVSALPAQVLATVRTMTLDELQAVAKLFDSLKASGLVGDTCPIQFMPV